MTRSDTSSDPIRPHPRPGSSRPVPARPDPPKPTRPDPARPDQTRHDPIRTGLTRPDPNRHDSTQPVPPPTRSRRRRDGSARRVVVTALKKLSHIDRSQANPRPAQPNSPNSIHYQNSPNLRIRRNRGVRQTLQPVPSGVKIMGQNNGTKIWHRNDITEIMVKKYVHK